MVAPLVLDASPEKHELLRVMRGAHRARPGTVLEVGCGGGWYISNLYREGATPCVGTDLERSGLRVAARRHRGPSWVQSDATRLPFRDGSVPVVVCSEVLEHVPDHEAVARELARVLAPGGRIVLTVPNERARWGWGFSAFDQRVGHLRRYTMESLRALFPPLWRVRVERHYGHVYALAAYALIDWPLSRRAGPGGTPFSSSESTKFFVEAPPTLRGARAALARVAVVAFRALFRLDAAIMGRVRNGNGLLMVLERPG